MAADGPAREPPPYDRARDVRQRPRADVAALVAMEVDGEPALSGQIEQAIEQRVDLGRDEGDGAQDPAGRGDPVRHLRTLGGAEDLERSQRHRLELDAPRPLLAKLLEHRPGDRALRGHGIQVSANRPGAVRPAAAQPEVHAAADVVGRPARGPVRGDRAQGAGEGAVRVRGALPRVPLVEVRVHVDQAGPDLRALEVDVGVGPR